MSIGHINDGNLYYQMVSLSCKSAEIPRRYYFRSTPLDAIRMPRLAQTIPMQYEMRNMQFSSFSTLFPTLIPIFPELPAILSHLDLWTASLILLSSTYLLFSRIHANRLFGNQKRSAFFSFHQPNQTLQPSAIQPTGPSLIR